MPQTVIDIRRPEADTPPKMNYEEFLERYAGVRAEWIDGEVELMSPVSNAHQRIGNFLFRVISDFVEAYDLGQVFQLEFQMKLVGQKRGREPDLFFVPKAKYWQIHPGYFDGPADLVIEIISPESVERDRVKKFGEYQKGGVPEFWLIDPVAQEVTFFHRDAFGRFQAVSPGEDGIYHCPALPGFWVRLDWLWQSPPPPLPAVRKELGIS